MYSTDDTTNSNDIHSVNSGSYIVEESSSCIYNKCTNYCISIITRIILFLRQIYAIIKMRSVEISISWRQFVFSHIIVSFLISLIITVCCRDINYPAVLLTSDNIGGIGETLISFGTNSHIINDKRVDSLSEIFNKSEYKSNISWKKDIIDSKEMRKLMNNEYYCHDSNRWASFVVDDIDNGWIESSISIDSSYFSLNLSTINDEINKANQYLSTQEMSQKRSDVFIRTNSNDNSSSIVIKSYVLLYSNLTMLSNITSDHAGPIYLKKILPLLYNSIHNNDYSKNLKQNYKNLSMLSPSYTLISHPLQIKNYTNEIYLKRGYLGATIILLYMIITSSISVKFITYFQNSGMKAQLHFSGLNPFIYWLSNLIMDTLVINTSLVSISCGILLGNEPVSIYYFHVPPYPGYLLLICVFSFSFAFVSGSYLLCITSTNQLMCQLLILLHSITIGFFLKLFLLRQKSKFYIHISKICLWISPSYTFSTSMFDIFSLSLLKLSDIKNSNNRHQINSIIHTIESNVLIMIFQGIFYLAITIALDYYWIYILTKLRKLKFHVCLFINEIWNSKQIQNTELDITNISSFENKNHKIVKNSSCYGNSILDHDIENDSNDINNNKGMDGDNIVYIKDLSIRHNETCNNVIKGININIKKGEKIALMGSNGGGKTTLFKTLALAENVPLHGQVDIDGYNLINNTWDISKKAIIGYVPQEKGLFEFLTVKETLKLFHDIKGLIIFMLYNNKFRY
jgi:ABC-type multidrug transport system fused ATPase/permease subunit